MNKKFEIVFMEEAMNFLDGLEEKVRKKIIYNIDKSSYKNDPKLFKKLSKSIWEFRTRYEGKQYRLFAFWDKKGSRDTLVVSTHGFVKKVQKTPKSEIKKAENLREQYFSN